MNKEVIDLVTSCLELLTAIIAPAAVWFGFHTWKAEYIGKKRIELVEELLALFFEVRDKIGTIRNPFVFSGEIVKVREKDSKLTDDTNKQNIAVIYQRFDQSSETFAKFHAIKYRVMATFGEKYGSIFSDVNKQLNAISLSAKMLNDYYWARPADYLEESEKKKHFEERDRHEGIIWSGLKDNDQISEALKAVYVEIDRLAEAERKKLGKVL